jgi:hypothetical protein
MNTNALNAKTEKVRKNGENAILRKPNLAKLPLDGIWMMTLTNYPKLFLSEMKCKFEGCHTAETFIRVPSFETGLAGLESIYRLIGENAFFQNDERSLDKGQSIYLAIHVYMGIAD